MGLDQMAGLCKLHMDVKDGICRLPPRHGYGPHIVQKTKRGTNQITTLINKLLQGKLLATNEISAVKVVFLKEDELRETLLEMEILKACNHPNITRYMGCFLKGLDLWVSICTLPSETTYQGRANA